MQIYWNKRKHLCKDWFATPTWLPFHCFGTPICRVRTGHGKPGKSWNLSISVSRPGKSGNFIVGHGKVMENYSVCGA